MGRVARRRREASEARTSPPVAEAPPLDKLGNPLSPASRPEALFHGGVRGLRPGGRIRSAEVLALPPIGYSSGTKYLPGLVYLTAHEDTARAYAARYFDARLQQSLPGDLYEVRPVGGLWVDPDYRTDGSADNVFLACREAEVVRVVERRVRRTADEQVRLEQPYLVWAGSDEPVLNEAGRMLPSAEMRQLGVSEEWLGLLRPWLRGTDVDARGHLSLFAEANSKMPREARMERLLEVLPALDRPGHEVTWARLVVGNDVQAELRCSRCSRQFGQVQGLAAWHQLGERAMELLMQVHDWDHQAVLVTRDVAMAARRRRPDRWQ